MAKTQAARASESLNGVAAKVLAVVPLSEPWTVAAICTELGRHGSRIDFNIVQGCLRALVTSGHVREAPSQYFRRTTVASQDEPEPKSVLRVVHPQPEPAMALPAHVAKEIAEAHASEYVTEREPLRDIGALAQRMRESGRALIMWAEDLERLGLEYEGRVEAAGQDGKQLAQLRKILQNLGV
jgi:hypothetical protein